MRAGTTPLPGIRLLEPEVHRDPRGSFLELWRRDGYAAMGLPDFVQTNVARSRAGVLRGLHLQVPRPQGKLVYALSGEIWDVCVDVRRGSPMFGQWFGTTLDAYDLRQLYVPPGFAHGYCVIEGPAVVVYHCTEYYAPRCELRIAWNDSDLAIDWPVRRPLLSEADAAAPRLDQIPSDRLPVYRATDACLATAGP
jgi:dTDP-4-dehydrorhamnose 3,5-epimerase